VKDGAAFVKTPLSFQIAALAGSDNTRLFRCETMSFYIRYKKTLDHQPVGFSIDRYLPLERDLLI
jgi:hypothetical protein